MSETEYKALVERLDGVIRRNTLAMEAVTGAITQMHVAITHMNRSIDDLGDQVRANTNALLRLIDRFDAAGGTA